MGYLTEILHRKWNKEEANELLEALRDLDEGRLAQIIPELEEAKGFQQNHPCHFLDVYQHTIQVINGLPSNGLLRLVALFHDLGKIYCKVVDDAGVEHFWGHESKSVEIAMETMTRLGFTESIIALVALLVKYHDTPLKNDNTKLHEAAIRYGQEYLRMLQSYQQAQNSSLDIKQAIANSDPWSPDDVKKIGIEILELLFQHQLSDLRAHSKEYVVKKESVLLELLNKLPLI